jgi:hypothetical protein
MLIGKVMVLESRCEVGAPFSFGANSVLCALEVGITTGYCAAMVL